MAIKRLPKKGCIAVTSPSSPVVAEKLERGVRYLESLGYRVKVGKSCTQSEAYFAGSIRDRAEELNDFFTDPKIDAIFCGRGGFGSMYLLPHLNYSAIALSGKLFVGFSDITALQWGIWHRCSLPTVSAGMVATDMSNVPVNPEFEASFWQMIEHGTCAYPITPYRDHIEEVEGLCLPGTLAVAAKLIGTPYFPSTQQMLLVLEDVDEPMHKIDGYLGQFVMAGLIDQAKGVLLGHYNRLEQEPYVEVPSFESMVERVFADTQKPLAIHTGYGHTPTKWALPTGIRLRAKFGNSPTLFTPESIYA
jgi:muramoyltetrapeptide carboxypeptidase